VTVSLSAQAKARIRLQRLFSTFPGGLPGLGLLLLRIVSGAVALLQGGAIALGGAAPVDWIAGLLVAASGVVLLLGFLTPIACGFLAIGGASVALDWAALPPRYLLNDPLSAILIAAIAVAMACLGPGAFSVDAWLFGRREVLIRR
jgi:uncharacterized membrane protein YphA (DoxX/SURF4 family)